MTKITQKTLMDSIANHPFIDPVPQKSMNCLKTSLADSCLKRDPCKRILNMDLMVTDML